jgi:Glycoside hydrolase family 44
MRGAHWAWRLSATALMLAAALLVAPATSVASPGPALAVNGGADHHAIGPYIYGMNFASPRLANQLDLPVDRWGGNTSDTYNWKIGSSNTGNDYYFENIPDCFDAPTYTCDDGPKFGYQRFVQKDRSIGAQSLMTLPMMGWVAKDGKPNHPFTCGFPPSVSMNQTFDPYDSNCGNGVRKSNGSLLSSNPSRDGVRIGPSFDGDWVKKLKSLYGSAANGGIRFYELGNEPGLWNSTHRDMHPAPETYDELWQKTRDYGAAVRAADPSAKILGFSEWGWPNYFCSAADHIDSGCFASSPDRKKHGGTPLVEWLLRKLRSYQQAHGARLVDYLDLHYYAQGGDNTDVTRSLWDPTYTDPSWIDSKIQLLPRMRQWVARDYPGTKTSLSEYNLSVADATTNALIEADTLGIFAREGLDLATFWPMPNDGSLLDDAFRMYRDYNGHGAKFGNTWVRSTSANQAKVAVYGARRSSDGAYTILVINKTDTALESKLSLSGISPSGKAQVWRWTGGSIDRMSDRTVPAGGFSASYPGQSLTLYVIPS